MVQRSMLSQSRNCKSIQQVMLLIPLSFMLNPTIFFESHISNQAFQFPVVAQPRKPSETIENQETRNPKNLCPILQKHLRRARDGNRENLWKREKPLEQQCNLCHIYHKLCYLHQFFMYFL